MAAELWRFDEVGARIAAADAHTVQPVELVARQSCGCEPLPARR
jgi:hypothetical protein